MRAAPKKVRLRGLGVERLLNEARRLHMTLTDVRRQPDRSVTCRCAGRDYEAFCALAEEKGFETQTLPPSGLWRALNLIAGRKGLWAGAALFVALVFTAPRFLWHVDIRDAGPYTGEVRAFLEEMGVGPGMPKRDIDLASLREKLEWRLPRVAWVRAELSGVSLVITLVEGVAAPDVETAGAPGDVIAERDGILARLTVFAGTPLAKAGDLVRKGQVLIAGAERGAGEDTLPVKARGEAVARVWLSAAVRMPAKDTLSSPTGRAFSRRVLRGPGIGAAFSSQPDYLTWDMDVQRVTLGGAWLPLWLERETYFEVSLDQAPRDLDALKAQSGAAALKRLAALLTSRDDVVDKWVDYSMIEGDTIEATATAEVLLDIARFRPSQ